MRVRILIAPLVEKRHRITVGREFETCDPPEERDEDETWIISEADEPVRLWPNEFEEVGDYEPS